eukprot:3763088-Pyramimonas_sp.AAC.1
MPAAASAAVADQPKLFFAQSATKKPVPGCAGAPLAPDLRAAVAWMRARSPGSVMREREAHARRVEARGRLLASSGAASAWFRGRDPQARRVSADVNGPPLE